MSQAIFEKVISNFNKNYDLGVSTTKEVSFPKNDELRGKIPKYSTINSVSLSMTVKLTNKGGLLSTDGSAIKAIIYRTYGYTSDGSKLTSSHYYGGMDGKNIIPKGSDIDTTGTIEQILDVANYSSQTERAGVFVPGTLYNGDSSADSTKSFTAGVNIFDNGKEVSVYDINLIYNFIGPTISINSGTGGTVTNSGNHTIERTSKIECRATPNQGYRFVRWSDGKVNNPRIFSEDNEDVTGIISTYTAEFEPYWMIEYNGVEHEYNRVEQEEIIDTLPKGYLTDRGSLDKNLNIIGETSFQLPSNLTRRGYTFKGWSGTGISGVVLDNINIQLQGASEHKEFTANWEPIHYSITYDYDGGYFIDNEILTYTVEDSIDLQVPSKTGYRFVGWTGTDLVGQTPQVSFSNQIGDRKYFAHWEIKQFDITGLCYPNDAGTVEMTIDKEKYLSYPITKNYNQIISQIVAITSNTIKYQFDRFEIINEDSGTVVDTFYNNLLTEQRFEAYNTIFKACFKLRNYPIQVSSVILSKDEYGNDSEEIGDCALFTLNNSFSFSNQEYGSKVFISFVPMQGYKFVKWKGIESSKAKKSILEYTVTNNNNVIAYFERINEKQDSIPEDIEEKGEEVKNEILTSLTDSIIDKSIQKYINTKKIKRIGDYAFYKCENLTFVNISDVEEEILGKRAFSHCKSLSFIKLSDKIKQIDTEAFGDCNNLTTIIIPYEKEVVQLLDGTVFSNTPYEDNYGYIYVPKSLLTKYKSGDYPNWSLIDPNHFLPIEDYPGEVETEND